MSILMVKKGNKLVFDIIIRMETGIVFCPYIKRMSNKNCLPLHHMQKAMEHQ